MYNIYIKYHKIFLFHIYIIHTYYESYLEIQIHVCSRAHPRKSHMITGESNRSHRRFLSPSVDDDQITKINHSERVGISIRICDLGARRP